MQNFLREIGWVDELGSGVRNICKYNKIYSGADPEFIEGDIFKTIIPLTPQDTPQDTPHDYAENELRIAGIMEFCKVPRSRHEIQEYIKITDREYFRKKILIPLLEKGLLKMTQPNKPTSKNQKYYS